MMEWYYASNGQQKGPVSQDELAKLFQNGAVKGSDLVWNDSMSDWTPIGQLAEFKPAEQAPTTGAPSAPEPLAQPAATPPATPVQSPAVPAQPANPIANQLNPGEAPIPTYMWQSIVCTILCCIPLGVVAIVFASKVQPALMQGDLVSAREASQKAKMWCWIAFGIGLIGNLLYLAFVVLGAFAGAV